MKHIKEYDEFINEAYDKRAYDSFTKYLQKNAASANLELFDPIPVGGSIFNKDYEKADNVLSFDWNIIDGKYTGSVKQKIDNFFKKAAAKFNMKPIHIQVGSVEFVPASPIKESSVNEEKYNTVEKVVKKLGRRPSEEELASFITKNYYDVTGVKRGDDDPSQNEKIVDLISFYNFDHADFEIAWHDAQNESVNEASGEFVVYVEKDNGRKKLLHTKKSQRAANMFMSKNMDKILNTSGIRSIGSMSKDEWEKKEAQFAENIKKTGMKTVTKKEWDRTHKDYKGMIKGKPYIMWFDKKTQSTVYGPVNIKESVNESTPDQVIKDLDKAKNDLLKKVNALIAKKKKLYSDVDIEAPMSADEKKLDKDIADLFSQINKLVLQKKRIKTIEL